MCPKYKVLDKQEMFEAHKNVYICEGKWIPSNYFHLKCFRFWYSTVSKLSSVNVEKLLQSRRLCRVRKRNVEKTEFAFESKLTHDIKKRAIVNIRVIFKLLQMCTRTRYLSCKQCNFNKFGDRTNCWTFLMITCSENLTLNMDLMIRWML